ncbi:penicillin-binding protein 1B [Pseudobacteriovorax antillogorgiicola]|uniref:Penicillin-binding protein 1B n=1 Tax=Pseudobacteriovorax antillogorgiicola TaxID=1513793 RepID=A0A1Y6CFD3_9BACT|nr:penicillin-binding protein 1B [Pseudobacteriovorax antillogorgiicola]TCS51712.1 penicillin-binding protein 1B [Pseudobacteriovorax antillogorgiicola]SMF49326.1 penicillin-binding protein 1B [Pseudobacteriovorax antillogorgiicola]
MKSFLKVLSISLVIGLLAGLVFLDFQVRQKFEGKKWRLPSLVYGRAMELYDGKELNDRYLRRELLESGYIPVVDVQAPGQFSVRGDRYKIYKRMFQFWDEKEPAQLVSFEVSAGGLSDLSIDEQPVDLVRLEPLMVGGMYPHHFEDRKLIKLQQAPQVLIDALIAVEDQGFYEHWGISPKGIARAIYSNIKAGRVVQGASTLTQQLVKNFYLSSERSLRRKLLEAVYSLLLELHYSKEEILETYLNEVYLAQNGNRAIHGFGLASEYYFSKSIEELSLDEAALLVALVNGPSYFNPRRHPKRCLSRRNKVLRMLFEAGKIEEEAYQEALKKPLKVPPTPKTKSIRYPGYLDLVKRHLERDYYAEDLQGEGMRIFTAFDPHSQWAAEDAVDQVIKRWGRAGEDLEAAVIVAGASGDVEAVVGSKRSGYQGFNRALDSKRSIGSLVKPAVVLAALETKEYVLSSMIDDAPIELKQADGKIWKPQNYDQKNHGLVPLYQALSHSYNQATVRLGLDIGPEKVADTLRRLGVSDEIPTNPAMLLGSFGLSPFEVMNIFQTLSSAGFRAQLRSVRYVMNYRDQVLQSYPPNIQQVFSPGLLHILQYALQVVMYEGTGKSAYNTIDDELRAAGKTGTSNDKRDSWFAGFTGDKLSVVWMGRDDYAKTPLTGSSGALQVWARLMKDISRQPLNFQKPDDVDYFWVDEDNGRGSFHFCQGVRNMPFLKGQEPEGQSPCIKSMDPVMDWFKRLFE